MATKVDGRGATIDTLLQLKDAGLVAASAAAQVSGSDQVLDLGDGEIEWHILIDISAAEVDTGDELYTITLQGDDANTFATDAVELASFKAGDATQLVGTADITTGRFKIPFSNRHGDRTCQYVRLYTTVAGTIATGINYVAYLAA